MMKMTSDHEHRCSLILEGIHIYRAQHFFNDSQWPWCLVIAQLATQKDLEENHYLDEEGILFGKQLWGSHIALIVVSHWRINLRKESS